MKLKIISDIHLEFIKDYKKIIDELFNKTHKETILGLLGDICRLDTTENIEKYKYLLKTVSDKYYNVLIITGNHEYYGSFIHDIDKLINNICSEFTNVHFINNKIAQIGNYNILGCTLWSELDKKNEFLIISSINDFKYINVEIPDERFDYIEGTDCGVYTNSKLTFDFYNKLHKKDLTWIENNIDPNKKNIILTHHAPLIYHTQDKKYYNSPTKSVFCTDLTNLIKNENIVIWGFGHTHYQCEFYAYNTLVMSNPIGYPDEYKKINKIKTISLG